MTAYDIFYHQIKYSCDYRENISKVISVIYWVLFSRIEDNIFPCLPMSSNVYFIYSRGCLK